jgi:hypothetical protein
MAAFQTTFGFTALSSDGAFAVHMAVMLALKRLDVALTFFNNRECHQDLRLRVSRVDLLLRAVSLLLRFVKTAMFAKCRLMPIRD